MVRHEHGSGSGEDHLAGLSLIGSSPCLDFVNTEGGRRNDPPERLQDYADLVRWGAYAGLLEEGDVERLLELAAADPARADEVHARAIDLREALFRIFDALRQGEATHEADRAILNDELAEALARQRLVPADGGFVWETAGEDRLERILWILARDAADLLSSRELERVKKCSGETCDWLFLDESRNRSRRWCQMSECGNRAKQRRYQRRRRPAQKA